MTVLPMSASLDNLVYLSSGDWEAYVLPAFGANVIRLACQGREILRTPPDLAALVATPVVYGLPILLPPNRTADGRFSFDGRTWQLPLNEPARHNHLHGLVCSAAFAVTGRKPDRLVCDLDNDGSLFPFPCRLTCRIQLTPAGLEHELTVTNTGSGRMPLAVGYHTNFREPAKLAVPIGQRWETDARYLPTGRLLDLDSREKAYRDGFTPDGGCVSGFFTAAGLTAEIGSFAYTVSEPFDQWILYNGDGQQGFVSIEPQVGPVNSLNRPGSYPILEPGGQVTLTSRIQCRQKPCQKMEEPYAST